MLRGIKRMWRYGAAKLTSVFNERADPKIQLEQAFAEASRSHLQLTGQAALVIANQKQTEMRLSRAVEHLDRVQRNVRQAVAMADDARRDGDVAEYEDLSGIAEVLVAETIAVEAEIEALKEMSEQTAQASSQAKAAVEQSSLALKQMTTKKNLLLSQLTQAKMQEQTNKALHGLSGGDTPTLDEVRDKIESRYAKARGMAELGSGSVESRTLAIENAAASQQAKERLAQIRGTLGLPVMEETT